MKEKRSIQ